MNFKHKIILIPELPFSSKTPKSSSLSDVFFLCLLSLVRKHSLGLVFRHLSDVMSRDKRSTQIFEMTDPNVMEWSEVKRNWHMSSS